MKTRRFNTRALFYTLAILAGAALALTPFAVAYFTTGALTLAAAAKVITDFVALPAANAVFGWLLDAVGPWWGLTVASVLPLAITGVVDAVQTGVSAISNPKTVNDDPLFHVNTARQSGDGTDTPRQVRREPSPQHSPNADVSNEVVSDLDSEERVGMAP